MLHVRLAACVLVMGAALARAADLAPPAPASAKPVTKLGGPAGDLLRKWWAEGSAAGNQGDCYDNRDRGHSQLDLALFPQLGIVKYSDDEFKVRADWAAARTVRPGITFGNSSTSAGINQGGSNIRSYYTFHQGMTFLWTQYTHNNLYIYPEHCDHRPGHNGYPGNHGDVYPTNSAYLIASQGSSGSDQPFMRAVPLALAAMRPEVKSRLAAAGQLMPTVQMLLRRTMKNLAGPQDYLTGKAHPTVFEGGNVNDLALAQAAHDLEPDKLPPFAQLGIVEEDQATSGVDYFDPGRSEVLCNTRGCIGRIVRGGRYVYRMVVSAEPSSDLNARPLTYQWVVLRGDPAKITITPRNASGAVVELRVPYQPRVPIAPGAALESNRVDIGLFVFNGTHYSAPAFVTFFSLDSESRTYDAGGKLIEIGYGAGTTTVTVSDWPGLFALLAEGQTSAGAKFLRGRLTAEQVTTLRTAADQHAPLLAALTTAQDKAKQAAETKTRAAAALATAEQTKAAAQKAHDAKPTAQTTTAVERADAAVATAQAGKKIAETEDAAARPAADKAKSAAEAALAPARQIIEPLLTKLADDPGFCGTQAELLAAQLAAADLRHKSEFQAARKRLQDYGLAAPVGGPATVAASTGSKLPAAPAAERFTNFERLLLAQLNGAALAHLLLPGVVDATWRANYVDPRLSTPKTWRDVYHYDATGRATGWTRYDRGTMTDYTADGRAILARDGAGKPTRVAPVRYQQDAPTPGAGGFNDKPLKVVIDTAAATAPGE